MSILTSFLILCLSSYIFNVLRSKLQRIFVEIKFKIANILSNDLVRNQLVGIYSIFMDVCGSQSPIGHDRRSEFSVCLVSKSPHVIMIFVDNPG